MRAGKLRETITIQQPNETQNAYGEIVQAWTTFATSRASVEPLQGREYFASKSVNADITIRFRMRYISGVTAKMRVLYGSMTFDIQSVINVNERDRELVLMCKERL